MKTLVPFLAVLCALSFGAAFAQGQSNNRGTQERPADTVAPAIPGVVAAGSKVTVIQHGFQNTEGPVPMPDGSVVFTESRGSLLTKIDKDGKVSPFLSDASNSNGMGLDSKGRLISTQPLQVGVVYPKGSEAVIAGPYEARPNDLVIAKNDAIYFTLPGHKPPAVFYVPPGGKAVFAAEAPGPHGIQLSPDEKTLYVADSAGEYLVAFDVQPDGGLTNRRDFGRYEGLTEKDGVYDSHADGIAIDSEGRIYVGTFQGVQVFTPQGQNLGVIPVSQRPQNLTFGGPDKKTLYIAGQGAMYKLQMLAQGYKGRAR